MAGNHFSKLLGAFVFIVLLAGAIFAFTHYRGVKRGQTAQSGSAVSAAVPSATAVADSQPIQGADVVDLRKNEQDLMAIVDAQNPNVALVELETRMATDPVVFKNCHELAHEIGHEAIAKYKDFGTALKYQKQTCSDGYLHGIIEETFGDQPDNTLHLVQQMGPVCDSLGDLRGRCYHGIGHATMFSTDGNLPKSLTMCETFSGMPRSRCYEGVFMQNFLSDPDAHVSPYTDPKNPFFPCPTEATQYKPYCYFYAPIFYLDQQTDSNDFAKALQWCGTSPEQAYVAACVRGTGSLIVKYNAKDALFGEHLCAASPFVQSCISGMVSYGMTFYDTVEAVTQNICAPMDMPYKSMCTDDLGLKGYLF